MIKIFKKKLLHNNFVFIDGISKSGKIVISSIVSSLKNCENQTYQHRFNDYIKFANLKLLNDDLCIATILRDMQIQMIENRLSRHLNFRKHDFSSVDNSFNKKKYYQYLKIKDNDFEINKIIKDLKKDKALIPIVVDDFFTNCSRKLNFFFNFKKIIMLRNPIGIFYDHYIRNKIEKQINEHPWQIGLHYIKKNKKFPFFLEPKNIDRFNSANKIEKYMMVISSQYMPYLSKKIFKISKTKFVFIEDVWKNPKLMTNHLSKFLKTSPSKQTKLTLKKLNLPRYSADKAYEKQYYYLKHLMTNDEFKRLLKIESHYIEKKKLYGL